MAKVFADIIYVYIDRDEDYLNGSIFHLEPIYPLLYGTYYGILLMEQPDFGVFMLILIHVYTMRTDTSIHCLFARELGCQVF